MKKLVSILLLLTFALIPEAHCSDTKSQLKILGNQGFTDFVVIVDPTLTNDLNELKRVVKRFSKERHPTGCKILIWLSAKKAARKLPMTNAEVKSQYAVYDRNDMNGLNRLRILKSGDVIQDL